jgi:hypothetical protein
MVLTKDEVRASSKMVGAVKLLREIAGWERKEYEVEVIKKNRNIFAGANGTCMEEVWENDQKAYQNVVTCNLHHYLAG